MSVSAKRMLSETRSKLSEVDAELKRLSELDREHQQSVSALESEQKLAYLELAEILLPSLDETLLSRVAKLVSLPALSAAQVEAQRTLERTALQKQLAALEGQEAFVQRRPIQTLCTTRLRELAEAVTISRQCLAEYEALPLWNELYTSGYGTPGYTGQWYTMSYYRHWKHGDIAVETLGKELEISDFSALRARYDRDRLAHDKLLESERGWRQRLTETEELSNRHQALQNDLSNLDTRLCAALRDKLARHVNALPHDELLSMLGGDEVLRVAVKRLIGLEAKLLLLRKSYDEWLVKPLRKAEKLRAKYQKDIAKLSRPKNAGRTFDDEELTKLKGNEPADWRTARTHYADVHRSVTGFRDYDRYQGGAEQTWWLLMTQQQTPAPFLASDSRPNRPYDQAVTALADDASDSSTRWDDAS